MSYTHIHLPDLPSLKKLLKKNPNLITYYKKFDSLVGSNESIELITKK